MLSGPIRRSPLSCHPARHGRPEVAARAGACGAPCVVMRGPPRPGQEWPWVLSSSGLHRGCEFEWDDTKSNACFTERGFDFTYAVQVFLDPDRLVEVDNRFDYGKPRYRVLGQIEGRRAPDDRGPQGQRQGGGSLWAQFA